MIRVFKHYVPRAVLLLGVLDFVLLLLSAQFAWVLRAKEIGMDPRIGPHVVAPMLTFACSILAAMIAVGLYGNEALRSVRYAFARLLVAIALGMVAQAVLHFLVPGATLWRSNSLYAVVFALLGMTIVRILLRRVWGGETFLRRIVVLGAGQRADRIRRLQRRPGASFAVVGYVGMSGGTHVVAEAVDRASIANLADHVRALGAGEVVLALEERRNAVPMADLLRIKTAGVLVNHLSSFLEKETGRVDLDSVDPSWLIFSDGFTAGRRLSSVGKRLFDVVVSASILILFWPLILLAAALVKLDGGPAFFRQQRVGLYGQPFWLLKLRTMRTDAESGGQAQWAEENDPRVTPIGRWLRILRIDELPQCWTVLKGRMSFVGPRPEQRAFVDALEKQLRYYAERHMVKPGITGWAQINYPYGASIEDARHKLEYDLYYAKNYTPFLDLLILLRTARVILWPEGAR